uniref:myocardin-like n=1 Tax=Pristiophorus japonicus TaxID=55135 RepID=UPI00398E4205
MKQKKARLADNLNEKILHRPGPLELVEKNILPLNSTVKHAMKVGQIQLPQAAETSPFEDDGSSSNSGSRPSPGMLGAPQQQAARTALGPCTPLACSLGLKHRRDFSTSVPEPVGETKIVASNGQLVPILPVPTVPTGLQRVSDGAKPQRQKKAKDPKPKVKKLKYHQYIPPDQKAEKSPIAMDAAYSRLLQQQQIFLQLQILNQQQQSFSFQTIQPGTPGLAPDQIIRFASAVPTPVPCVPLSPITKSSHRAAITTSAKPELLPANLDDLTVSELRQQLRKRGLPVSGTKPTLLERLKPYQICSPKPAPPPMAGGPAFEPPAGGLSREGLRLSPPAAGPTGPAGKPQPGSSLVEKEKVIERLTWKLQHEQRQAEDLRLELELRKQRHRQAPGPLGARPFPGPAFPGPGQASETSRPGSPVGPGYGRGLAQASPATAVAREAEARGGAPSPANPFFFPPAATRPEEAVDGGSPCPQQQPRSRSPSRGHSGDGGLSDILVPRQIQPEFPYSPASLHSFFTLDDADIETKNESGSEENFESEVYLSASLGSEARDYSSLEALASSDSGGFPSLEEELTEAIKSAEVRCAFRIVVCLWFRSAVGKSAFDLVGKPPAGLAIVHLSYQ